MGKRIITDGNARQITDDDTLHLLASICKAVAQWRVECKATKGFTPNLNSAFMWVLEQWHDAGKISWPEMRPLADVLMHLTRDAAMFEGLWDAYDSREDTPDVVPQAFNARNVTVFVTN